MVWKFVHCTVFFMCCVWVFGTLVPCALFLLFLKICSYVNALCNVLNVFCIIHWYFSPSRTVLNAFFTICGYVSFLRTFFNVFCMIVWYVSAPCTDLKCSVRVVLALVFCALFWICCVWFFFHVSLLHTVLHVYCLNVCHVSRMRTVL